MDKARPKKTLNRSNAAKLRELVLDAIRDIGSASATVGTPNPPDGTPYSNIVTHANMAGRTLAQIDKALAQLTRAGAIYEVEDSSGASYYRFRAPVQLPAGWSTHPVVLHEVGTAVQRVVEDCAAQLCQGGTGGGFTQSTLAARIAQLRADAERYKKLAIDELDQRHAAEAALAGERQLRNAQRLEMQEKLDKSERSEYEALKDLEALRDKFRALDACYRGLFDTETED